MATATRGRQTTIIGEIETAMTQRNSAIVRNICLTAAAATTVGLAALFASADLLFRFAIDTQWKHSIFHQAAIAPERDEKMRAGEAGGAMEWFDQAKQPIAITSGDGLRLRGWIFDPDCVDPEPHIYAICMHGYTGAPEEMAKWAHRLARMGFTVLVPSQRAQASSEGRYVGMGWLERNDLLGWIHAIVAGDEQARILLYGGSMGASTVMMAAGDPRLPRNVVAAVAESGYASARSEFIDAARGMFHLPRFLAAICVDAAGLVCKYRAGYDFADASCVRSLRHTVIPMLFIHGGDDRMVSPRSLDANYAACSSLDRTRLLVPGAGHMESSATDPKTYWRTYEGFVKRVFGL